MTRIHRRLAWIGALLLSALCTAQAAPQPTIKLDIAPQSIDAALNEFARQSGLQVILQTEEARGIKSKRLVGTFTPQAALTQLLSDTGLSFEYLNDRTVAVRSKSGTTPGAALAPQERGLVQASEMRMAQSAAGVEAPRNAAASQSDEKKNTSGDSEDAQEVLVTGRRIDGLNNKGLLQSGENAALYHDIFTAEDIARFGISSVEELFRLIPQTSSASTSLQVPSTNVGTSGGLTPRTSSVGLRGFSSTQTVVLVNGRALPRSSTTSGADISRIPIAAIERVEILPYAGSAIYGAGALGGAINIILRKEFSGQDLNTYVGTSTEGGGSEYRMSYLGGFNFNESRTTLTTTASYHHRDALRANDRDYLDEALRRYGPTSTATNAQGVRLFETLILPAFAGAPGTILVGNTPTAALNDLGIPGAAGARFAAIPAGLTAAQAAALTPQSFAATARTANLSEPRYGRSVLYEPVDSYSVNAQVEHELMQDKLRAYGEFTWGYNRRNYSAPQNFIIQLSATDPLNPFRTNVTPNFAGRPITIFLDTPDLPDPSNIYEYDSARAVLGLKGRISERWEWSTDGVLDYAYSTLNSNNPVSNLTSLTMLSPFASPGPAAAPATRRAIYPVFADHRANPLSATDVDNYFDSIRYSTNKSMQWEGNARVLGTVFNLPAGPLQTSALGKYQYWDFSFGQVLDGSDAWSQLVNNVPYQSTPTRTPVRRKVLQGAIELSIPIISRQWQPIPIESFEIQASYSRENDTSSSIESGVPFENKQSASSGVIAGRLQLTKDVAFRASYSEGFYPPDWSAVGSPVSTQMLPGFFADPARGNTLQFFTPGAPIMTILQGGNPGLQPETADSQNFGILLTPRFAPGFSMNVDFWRIEKVDAIVSSTFVDIIANPAAYGFLITRTQPTASDIAQGWLGFITQVDARAFNASVTRTQGTDVKLRYSLDTSWAGNYEFTVGGSFTNSFELLATPSSPVIETAGGSGPIRRRVHLAATWNYGNWSNTLTGRHVGPRSTSTTLPSSSYPGAFPIDGPRLPGSTQWDIQTAYDFGLGGTSMLSGTRLTFGVLNVLNEEPTFVSDGSSFYNGVQDPRQRVVYVQVKKSF